MRDVVSDIVVVGEVCAQITFPYKKSLAISEDSIMLMEFSRQYDASGAGSYACTWRSL